MSFPRDIFTTPNSVSKLASLNTRLRALERVAWGGRQKYLKEITTRTRITTSVYGLNPIFPDIPVYVPDDAWVAITAHVKFDIDSSQFTYINEVWGSVFERTDAADPFYGGQQVFYTMRGGNSSRGGSQQTPSYGYSNLNSNPGSRAGHLELEAMVYRPTAGEKIYTLDFRRELMNGFTPGVPPTENDWVDVTYAWLAVEIR